VSFRSESLLSFYDCCLICLVLSLDVFVILSWNALFALLMGIYMIFHIISYDNLMILISSSFLCCLSFHIVFFLFCSLAFSNEFIFHSFRCVKRDRQRDRDRWILVHSKYTLKLDSKGVLCVCYLCRDWKERKKE